MHAMRLLHGLLLAAFSVGAVAQSPLTTSFTGNTFLSSLDGAVYFDLHVHHELQLERLDLDLLSSAGTPGSVEVLVRPGSWVGHVADRGDWVQVGAGAVVAGGHHQPSPCVLQAPVGLPPGSYGIALHLRGLMPAYAFAFGPRSFGNGDLQLVAGGSAVRCLQGEPFTYRVFGGALHYTLGGGPHAVATVQAYGAGCQQGARSFYESFGPGELDLGGQRLRLVPNGQGGYDVQRSAAPPIVLPAGARSLGLLRGGAAFVALPQPLLFPGGSTPTLLVLADGRVMLTDQGLVGAGSTQPSPAALFGGRPLVAALWQDFAPTAANGVYVHQDAVSAATTVTWWHVPVTGAAAACTFSCTACLDGTLELCYDAIANPVDVSLVGFSAGAGARDPGPRDLSLAGPFATQHDDPGLLLAAEGRPVLGTTMLLRVVDRPLAAGNRVLLLGWTGLAPGIDLAGYGAPGCRLFVEPRGAVTFGLGAGTALAVPLPPDANLLGLGWCAQGASLAPGANALGFVTSNALACTLGTV